MRRSAAHMTDQQLVEEIHQLRDEMGDRAFRMVELSKRLNEQVRRKDTRRELDRLTDALTVVEEKLRLSSKEEAHDLREQVQKLRQEQIAQRDRVSTYTVFSNVYIRLAGMITQSLQRTKSTDRLVAQLPKVEDPETVARAKPAPVKELLAGSPIEDLMRMYSTGDDYAAR